MSDFEYIPEQTNRIWFYNAVQGLLDLRTKRILMRRMNGAALRDVAMEEGLTRSESRAIEKAAFEELCSSGETYIDDDFAVLFSTYSIEPEFFEQMLHGHSIQYYLNCRYEAGAEEFRKSLDDAALPEPIKRVLRVYYHINEKDLSTTPASLPDEVNAPELLQADENEGPLHESTDEQPHEPKLIPSDSDALPQYLKDDIQKFRNTLLSCGITENDRILEQSALLLFLKYLDDRELRHYANRMNTSVLTSNLYFDEAHTDCRWSFFHNLDSYELMNTLKQRVLPFLQKELPVDTELAYPRFVSKTPFRITDATLLTKLISFIDSMSGHSSYDLPRIYEEILSMSDIQTGYMKLLCSIIDLQLDDVVCNPFLSYDFDLSLAASFVKKEYAEKLKKVWHRTHLEQEMFTGFSLSEDVLSVSAARLAFQDITSPKLSTLNLLTTAYSGRFSKVITKIPSSMQTPPDQVRPSIRKVVTSNLPSLMYLYASHELLQEDGTAALFITKKDLYDTTASHLRLRKLLIEENTILCVIHIENAVRDLLIYQKKKTEGGYPIPFIHVNVFSESIIRSLSEMYHNRSQKADITISAFDAAGHDYSLFYESYIEKDTTRGVNYIALDTLDVILQRIYDRDAENNRIIQSIKQLLEDLS